MAEKPATRSADSTPPAADQRVLLVLIASDPNSMDDLLTALLDIGITGATLVESKGMAAVLREEMPIFAGLVALLPGATGSRMLFSVTTTAQAELFLKFIDEELRTDARPIAVVLPILMSAGLKR